MDDPSRYHWYGEEPFPLIPVAAAFLAGFVIMPLVAWGVLEVVDCALLEGLTP